MNKKFAKYLPYIIGKSNYLKVRFFYKHGRVPNLKNPRTFSEKLLVMKLDESSVEYANYADKYEVRNYVRSVVGDKYLIPLISKYTNTQQFLEDFNNLPSLFALKAAHGSGWNEIVFDKAKVDTMALSKKISMWLSENYYSYGLELQYKNIPPSIVVEELLLDDDGKVPADYKFYCFGNSGEKRIIIQLDVDRFGNHERLFYDENWNLSDVAILSSKSKLSSSSVPRPENLDEMIDIVKKLSEPFKFSRIDLYNCDGKIYFGEITFHPESGYGIYVQPKHQEYELGQLLD